MPTYRPNPILTRPARAEKPAPEKTPEPKKGTDEDKAPADAKTPKANAEEKEAGKTSGKKGKA